MAGLMVVLAFLWATSLLWTGRRNSPKNRAADARLAELEEN